MNVFHSTTDIDDVHENTQHYNYMVSLIVNNKSEFDCLISTMGGIESLAQNIKLKGNDGKPVELYFESEKEECIFLYKVKVSFEADQDYVTHIKNLVAKQELKEAETKKILKSGYGGYSSNNYGGWNPQTRKWEYPEDKKNKNAPDFGNKSEYKFLCGLIDNNMSTNKTDLHTVIDDAESMSAGCLYDVERYFDIMYSEYYKTNGIDPEEQRGRINKMISILKPYAGFKVGQGVIDYLTITLAELNQMFNYHYAY